MAIPLTAVVVLGAGPLQTGLLEAATFAPFLLVGLPAGVWVDRWPRRLIMIVADIGRTLCVGSIPLAAALGVLRLPQLYVAGVVTGVLTVFFDVAYQSILPALVPADEIVAANGRLTFTQSVAEIAGPGVGGALVATLGAARAVTADAASYVVSFASLLFVRGVREEPAPRADRRGLVAEVSEGLRYVVGHPVLGRIAGCTATWNYFSNVIMGVVVVYAVRDLAIRPSFVGLWFAVGSLGAPVGSLIAGRLSRRLGIGRAIVVSVWASNWTYLLVAVAPSGEARALPLLIASGVLGGGWGVAYNVIQISLRQTITPQRLQGRMNASMRFIVWGTLPLGALTGGVLGSLIGLRPTVLVGALGVVLTGLWVTTPAVLRVRVAADAVRGTEPVLLPAESLVTPLAEPPG